MKGALFALTAPLAVVLTGCGSKSEQGGGGSDACAAYGDGQKFKSGDEVVEFLKAQDRTTDQAQQCFNCIVAEVDGAAKGFKVPLNDDTVPWPGMQTFVSEFDDKKYSYIKLNDLSTIKDSDIDALDEVPDEWWYVLVDTTAQDCGADFSWDGPIDGSGGSADTGSTTTCTTDSDCWEMDMMYGFGWSCKGFNGGKASCVATCPTDTGGATACATREDGGATYFVSNGNACCATGFVCKNPGTPQGTCEAPQCKMAMSLPAQYSCPEGFVATVTHADGTVTKQQPGGGLVSGKQGGNDTCACESQYTTKELMQQAGEGSFFQRVGNIGL